MDRPNKLYSHISQMPMKKPNLFSSKFEIFNILNEAFYRIWNLIRKKSFALFRINGTFIKTANTITIKNVSWYVTELGELELFQLKLSLVK